MNTECPKCNSIKILKRKSVSKIETHKTRYVNGIGIQIKVVEPKFYVCCHCWHKFNIQ